MLKRIPVTQLRLGMFVQSLCGSWLDHPFWKKGGFLLDNQSDLQRLRESAVKEVWIDAGKGLDLPEEAAVSAAAVLPVTMPAGPAPARVALEEEIRHAALLCGRAKAAVVSMFHDARMGQAIDTAHASDLVDEISASVLRHPNALVSLVRLKTSDEYTYMHSVAVCALMIALARQLELSDPLVHEAGLAGLLHDIGKMAVPDPILNKPGKLTEQEFGLVRRHPQNGARMLLDCRQVSALVVDVCLHHHERIDGTGYPFGLAQEQISLLARMGTVCDVYDAITSDRPQEGLERRRGDPAHGRMERALRPAGVPRLRQGGGHLPGRRAGQAGKRAPRRGPRATRPLAADATGQGILLGPLEGADPAAGDRPG